MQYSFKPITLLSLITFLLLFGCTHKVEKQEASLQSGVKVELKQYQQSRFKQVEASFLTSKSKELVFRVLSDIDKTSEWLKRVDSLEVLEIYNNQKYLLRTIIAMPWPFQDREVITCVNTAFAETMIAIEIHSCSDQVAESEEYLRLPKVISSWKIRTLSNNFVEVKYNTWLDPEGNIPALIFNNELINSTKIDFEELQTIIKSTNLEDFFY